MAIGNVTNLRKRPDMRYRAFLSYSRHDNRIAARIHRFLDTYRVPKSLVGLHTTRGTIPRRLGPIFRDRSDLTSGGKVSGRILDALKNSNALIVLCSESAAASYWVNEEVRRFLEQREENVVFPGIVPGMSVGKDIERDFFPPALRGRELLATDFRDVRTKEGRIGDGYRRGRLKLVAGLIGVDLDVLVRRERTRSILRATMVTAISLFILLLALLAAALWVQGMQTEGARAFDEVQEYLTTGETGLGLAFLSSSRLDLLSPDRARALDMTVRIHEAMMEPLFENMSRSRPGFVYRVEDAFFIMTEQGPKPFPVGGVTELFIAARQSKALAMGDGGAWEVHLKTGRKRRLKDIGDISITQAYRTEHAWIGIGTNAVGGYIGLTAGSHTALMAVERDDETSSGIIVASPMTDFHVDWDCKTTWFATGLHEHPSLEEGTTHDLSQTVRILQAEDGISGPVGIWGLSFDSPAPPPAEKIEGRFRSIPTPHEFEALMPKHSVISERCQYFRATRMEPDVDPRLNITFPAFRPLQVVKKTDADVEKKKSQSLSGSHTRCTPRALDKIMNRNINFKQTPRLCSGGVMSLPHR